ncbi:MAG TPA: phospholipase D family protein [Spirochaetota bacterium]|nr:phospholipase D family protein [Spirochaetota bacterium]
MTTLFSILDKIEFLQVLYNDKSEEFNFDRIFDHNSFDEISIITFVSSPRFFFEKVKPFKKVTLILGIEDNASISRFYFDPVAQNEFYKDADDETISNIKNGNLKIYFSPLNTSIHSKLYILKNSSTGSTRIVLGSANFTENALSGKRQFEEILVYDDNYNEALVRFYEERYSYILKQCVDFIPERLKKKLKEGVSFVNIKLGEDDYIEAIKDNVKIINQTISVTEETARELDILKKDIHDQEENIKHSLESVNRTKIIFEAVSKNKHGVTAIITPSEVTRKKDIIIPKIFNKEIKKEFTDQRVFLQYIPNSESMFRRDIASGHSSNYAVKSDISVIKEKLLLLGKFIAAYDKFTTNDVKETKSRIFEVILYSFVSSYIWKIREEYARLDNKDEARASVPVFLLIAGLSQSGKTHLIKFISKIIGNCGQYYHYNRQSKLSSLDHISPQIIDNFLYEENLTPVFVDEITKDYFSSQSSVSSNYMGEDYVKKITNTREGKFPTIIATSNTDFSANAQVMRRIYYIQLNNPFDTGKKSETTKYFNDIYESFGTELFQDFLLRISHKFREGIPFDQEDFLNIGRSVFLDYFSETEMQIPEWFSDSRIDDYYLRGKQIWQRLYRTKKKGFTEDKTSNEITVDDDIVFGSKLSVSKEKRECLQYLSAGIVKEDKGLVVLNRNKFLKFISKKQWIASIFNR